MPTHLGPVNLVGLALLGAAFLWAIHLLFSTSRQKGTNHILVALSIGGWVVVFLAVLGASAATVLGIPLFLLFLFVAAMAVDRYRTCERQVLTWAIAVAVEKGYPLGPAVRAFADERTDELGRRAHELADLLDAGTPLPLALEQSGTPLPTAALLAANLHDTAGGFAAALREAARSGAEEDPVWQTLLLKSLYLFGVILFALYLGLMLMIFIVPTFQEIFLDFDTQMPPLTQWLFDSAQHLPVVLGIAALPLLVCLSAYVIGVWHYIGWLDWELPLVSWILRRIDSGYILQAIALGIEQRRPLPQTLDLVADSYPRSGMRTILCKARDEVFSGGDWCLALEKVGIIDPAETALLHSAERAGNLPWALREAAESGNRRLMLRLSTVINLGLPLLFLVAAVPIALCIIGLMQPLAVLIQNLSQ